MKKIITGYLFLFITTFIPTSFAETWEVAVDQHFPPYTFKDDNGNMTGIHVDIVKATMDFLRVSTNLSAYPWARIVKLTEGGKVDFSYPWVGKPIRFERYMMIGPIQDGRTVFMVKKDSDITFDKLSDLTGKRVGCVRGYAYTTDFDSADFITRDYGARDNKQLIKKFLKDRVDLIIGDENVLLYEAKEMGVSDQFKILPKPLKEVWRYANFPLGNKDKAARFAHGLNAIKENGTYQKILEKYR